MVCDYELAWSRLGSVIASKSQHGRDGLLCEMARIADECRVPAGELSRLLRLYGVEVERARSMSAGTDRAEPGAFGGGFDSPADPELAGHHRPGGHDGNRSAAGNGRRVV